MYVSTSSSLSPMQPSSPFRRLRRWLGGSFSPYIFIAPFFILFFAFGLYPLLYALGLSFTYWHGDEAPRFIGLSNYAYLVTSNLFWQSLANSAILWVLTVPVQIIVAVITAALLSRSTLRLRGFFRTALLSSYVVPLVAIAQVWLVLFDQDFGAINTLLHILHLPSIGWLTTSEWAKPTLALLVLWRGSGFSMLVMLAAIQSIPTEFYEAAAIDGASVFRQFLHITLPLLRRTIAFLVVISTLGVVQMFLEPKVLTNGGPYNSTMTAGFFLTTYINNADYGTGAANTFLLIILLVILSLVMLRFLRAGTES
ncbi:sugar ABC transporter permease [Ktedonosporobacter rubrisoli]|uniref:Sugar ABC transporter permease n=1 Tax=Ktedonosporobacter rubrisoli TaxID=2509675 RepID=A0A4P6JJK3_KTERU|nr:sugar ABC transporter permease [Ktedonosporobacter rubrisoli]QBD75110.1 sugar ABC transporter permease [Ktedonosporobacter rubrisoli]